MFTWGNFSQSTNWYKLPEEAICVCDIISEDNQVARVNVLEALISDIRQYNADIKLLYGRQLDKDNITSDPLYLVYEAVNIDFPDITLFASQGREEDCGYIVLDSRVHGIEIL